MEEKEVKVKNKLQINKASGDTSITSSTRKLYIKNQNK